VLVIWISMLSPLFGYVRNVTHLESFVKEKSKVF